MLRNKKTRPKVALALGSGGLKGGTHVGVIRALVENNIPIDFIVGSSVGAIVGALYALRKDLDVLYEMSESLLSGKFSREILSDLSLKGGISKGTKFVNLLQEYFNYATTEDLKIPFAAIGTNFYTGEKVILDEGSLADIAKMSSTIPGLFKPSIYKGVPIVDGGMVEQIPAKTCRDLGADIVIGSSLGYSIREDLIAQKRGIDDWRYWDNAKRSISILMLSLTKDDEFFCDVLIDPKIPRDINLGLKRDSVDDINRGYKETLHKILQIKDLIKSFSKSK